MRHFFLFLLLACVPSLQAAPNILTSIHPLQLIAGQILGEHGSADTLLPPGASPHAYSLRPSDQRKLMQADGFFWIGPDMENFLEKQAERRIDTSHAMQQLSGLHLLHYADGHDHHDHEHGLKEHDHDHAPGAVDAHLWLSSHNARVIAEYMAAEFARLNPSASMHYQANLKAFQQEMEALDKELAALLAEVQGAPFFVFHEAFNYLEQQYELPHRAVFALSAEVQPGARHVQHIRQMLERSGPACLFTEPPAAPRLVESLARDFPVRLQELDPMGQQADSYAALLRGLANQMHDCLSGLSATP